MYVVTAFIVLKPPLSAFRSGCSNASRRFTHRCSTDECHFGLEYRRHGWHRQFHSVLRRQFDCHFSVADNRNYWQADGSDSGPHVSVLPVCPELRQNCVLDEQQCHHAWVIRSLSNLNFYIKMSLRTTGQRPTLACSAVPLAACIQRHPCTSFCMLPPVSPETTFVDTANKNWLPCMATSLDGLKN